MKNISTKIINNIIKGKKTWGKDTDGDGVPNYKDCQPNNIMRQDKIKEFGNEKLSKWQNNLRKRVI